MRPGSLVGAKAEELPVVADHGYASVLPCMPVSSDAIGLGRITAGRKDCAA